MEALLWMRFQPTYRNDSGGIAPRMDGAIICRCAPTPCAWRFDQGIKKAMADRRIAAIGSAMPFDGKRTIYGGFETILSL
jgi:hypothetical protein